MQIKLAQNRIRVSQSVDDDHEMRSQHHHEWFALVHRGTEPLVEPRIGSRITWILVRHIRRLHHLLHSSEGEIDRDQGELTKMKWAEVYITPATNRSDTDSGFGAVLGQITPENVSPAADHVRTDVSLHHNK